jgi:predicted acyl esterase
MEKTHWKVIVPVLAAILLLSAWIFINQRKSGNQMISTFGKYQGYSEPVYDGTQRTSDYLTLSDGTRLAYDLIIPTKKGVLADKPLPVLFKYTPYGRTWTIFDKKGGFLLENFAFLDWPSKAMLRVRYILMGDKGRFMDPLFRDRWLENVVNHGYIVVSVDRPGTGASFSSPTPGSMETAAKFENEIMNWIAVQSWSDGNIGMYGD